MSLLKNRCHILFTGHLHKQVVKESGGVSYILLENYGSTDATGVFCRVYVSGDAVSWEFGE
ncbi:hypothetical protein AGMMS49928_23200 [Spirochaetia bacterium]|nr:hypothetical protein AGMMS49928_23200 [Spirochaetia bacterium]